MEFKRVVVTGLGAVTPLGNNIKDFWEGLANGVSGADIITRFDPTNHKTKFACEVKGFDATEHFDRKELRLLDLYSQFALVAADQSIIDSGMDIKAVDGDRIGVIFASGIGGIKAYQDELENYFKGGEFPKFNPFFIPKMISDIAAGHISMKYGFRGPNFATVSACASSTNAIIDATTYIRIGYADAFVGIIDQN